MIEEIRSRIARKRWQLELQVVYQHLTVIRALYSTPGRSKTQLLHTLQLPRTYYKEIREGVRVRETYVAYTLNTMHNLRLQKNVKY